VVVTSRAMRNDVARMSRLPATMNATNPMAARRSQRTQGRVAAAVSSTGTVRGTAAAPASGGGRSASRVLMRRR
jgi:hypothetical protein